MATGGMDQKFHTVHMRSCRRWPQAKKHGPPELTTKRVWRCPVTRLNLRTRSPLLQMHHGIHAHKMYRAVFSSQTLRFKKEKKKKKKSTSKFLTKRKVKGQVLHQPNYQVIGLKFVFAFQSGAFYSPPLLARYTLLKNQGPAFDLFCSQNTKNIRVCKVLLAEYTTVHVQVLLLPIRHSDTVLLFSLSPVHSHQTRFQVIQRHLIDTYSPFN